VDPLTGAAPPLALAFVLAGFASVVLATVLLLGARARLAPEGTLRLPTSGIVPLGYVGVLAAATTLLEIGGVHLSPTLSGWVRLGQGGYLGTGLVVALLVAVLFSRLFSPAPARLWLTGTLTTLAALAGLAGLATFVNAHTGIGWDVLGLVVPTAVVADAVAEWRARARLGELVAVHELHDVQRVDAALAQLAAEGIFAHARSAHHRALLYFFAPFLPLVIAVAPADAARARELVVR
jgi:hypothetical protein